MIGTLIVLGSISLAQAKISEDFQNLIVIPGLQVDLRYATENNFVGKNMYGDFKEAYLHREAFEKLRKANDLLQKRRPDLHLHILDALRPRSIQRVLYAKVKGTAQQSYVADPDKGSVHNFGFAVDLTLADLQGNEIDMGTVFDDFTALAQPRLEAKHLKEGLLTSDQISNRELLRDIMSQAGFASIPNEWWHFDALPLRVLKQKYKIVE